MTVQPITQLGTVSIADFLRDYWQQKPLLIRNAFPGFQSPLDGDDLAGLALEETVESRLVLERDTWELRQGPFSEDTFAQLPESHWTLLVQAVDQWVPEVQALLKAFAFLPSWRLDDIMVSYAADQGSVGPHFDYYDVFLLQGQGKRRWRIGQSCDAHSPRLDNTPLHILRDFHTCDEWLLEPGDMLYIPPGVAHWGVAEGECITYSVGFRAPGCADVLLELSQSVADTLNNDQRYSDPGLTPVQHPGEIDDDAIARVRAILQRELTDERIARWFGCHMSERKYPELYQPEEDADNNSDDWLIALDHGAQLERHPAARFAYRRLNETEADLFVDGQCLPACLELAQALCATGLNPQQLRTLAENDRNAAVIRQLLARESLWLDDGADDE